MQSTTALWERAQRAESAENRREARALYEQIIELDPRHVPARLRLSRLDQFADDYRSSKAHVLVAAEALEAKRSVRNLAYVTARLLEFSEEERAARIVLAADWSDPDVVRQAPVLAQHLSLAGRYDETLRFLDEMSRRAGSHPLLIFTRANVLRYVGDMQGAERGYEACIAIAPTFADAHLALATHSHAQPAFARIPRLRDALSCSAKDGLEEAQLSYALFHELDVAGDTQQAWAALARGMAIMRRRVVFDSQVESARLNAWMQISLDLRQIEESSQPRPLFIVGMPRTGTTLLDRMLSNHSQIASAGERNDFMAAVSDVTGRFFSSAAGRSPNDLPRSIDLGRIGKNYLERLRPRGRDARFVIDKNPQNLFNVPLILAALPQARVLCLLRNSMDACFSNLKELFHGNAYSYSYDMREVAGHCLRATGWMDHWRRMAPHAFGIVSYENLVSHPQKSLEGIARFLGLDPEANLHEVTRNRDPVSTASSSQVREAVHARGIDAWRRYGDYLQPLRESLGMQ